MIEQKRAALVTGASRGIGAAIARRLAGDGFAVVIHHAGRSDGAQRLADAIRGDGGDALALAADVRDSDAMASLFTKAEAAFGGLDVVVNNAGIMNLAAIGAMDDAAFDEQVAINVKGGFNTLRLAARRVRAGGRIVSISSSVVGLYQPTYGAYAATKAAIEAMTRVLAKEVASRDVTANAIAPGPVDTDLFRADKTAAEMNAIAARTPLGRLGLPDDIARAISFLAGPDGAWITGQVIRCNGGIV